MEELEVSTEEIKAQNEALELAQSRIDIEAQRYRELFEDAPDGYIVTDENGIIVESNRATTELLGIDSRLLLSKPLIVFVHSADRRVLLTALHEVQDGRGESVVDFEVRFAPLRGRAFAASVHAAASRVAPGVARTVRWLVRDVSRQVLTEEALADQEAHYRLLAASLANVVITTDRADRIVYASPPRRVCSVEDSPTWSTNTCPFFSTRRIGRSSPDCTSRPATVTHRHRVSSGSSTTVEDRSPWR
jgi:PAS domain S-box-containing protein